MDENVSLEMIAALFQEFCAGVVDPFSAPEYARGRHGLFWHCISIFVNNH
jgi:hypothetical protein